MQIPSQNPSFQVLEDADIPRAARAITSSALLHSGQICMSTERVIIQRGVATALVEELTALFRKGKAGDTYSDSTANLGPLFTEGSAENVVAMINDAVEQGARVLVGDRDRQGTIVQPHIVMDARPGMKLWERESFGPGTYRLIPWFSMTYDVCCWWLNMTCIQLGPGPG